MLATVVALVYGGAVTSIAHNSADRESLQLIQASLTSHQSFNYKSKIIKFHHEKAESFCLR